MIKYLPPGAQWDQTMIGELIDAELPDTRDGMILVIPGRYWHDRVDEINAVIARYSWVLAIRTGDEEDLFDPAEVVHPNIRWWIQTPRVGRDYGDARLIPLGYSPHFVDLLPDPPDKTLDVFLAAQDTHDRRHQAFDCLEGRRNSLTIRTPGFTRGIFPHTYLAKMIQTKVAPAPAGPATPDTFRLYEALQAHTVPIPEDTAYWRLLFPEAPFPVVEEWNQLDGLMDAVLGDWPRAANRVTAWWMNYKATMVRWLSDDLAALGATVTAPSTTVLITASPIKSHPSTAIIEETVASVRAQLPEAEIVIAHDGVRPEQEHLRADYEEYLRRLLWLADHSWHHVRPLIFDEHLHQGVLAKRALATITTPLVLFVEQDAPLRGEIPWANIELAILDGQANLVRFHHEASIPESHRYLMLDDEPQTVLGVPMIRTAQWSQRPHLASTAFYRMLLDEAFAEDQRDFVEDVVYGRECDAWTDHGVMGWYSWRTWIYSPPGSMVRSYHTDGRAGASKFQ